MKTHCTRLGCSRPTNVFGDLDNRKTLKTVQQKYCTSCGMPQILGGRYIPLKLLGKGGFGAAFLAVDRYTPKMRKCVVKQFQPSGDLQPSQLKIAQELFEREAEALEDLGNRHPQIPDLFAFFELQVPSAVAGKAEDYFYLVQEFIDGQTMEEEMAQRGAFSETEVVEVLTQVLKTLQFVHTNDAIHRDIKPSNIMRSRNGRIYLLDFGAVKQITIAQSAQPDPSGQQGQPQRSTGIYSMGFAPPEQMQGDKVYPATDLYALGVTCITLLTGKDPADLYDSYNHTWSWRAHAQVSDRLEAVLNQMLRTIPRERFQSADKVLAALKVSPSPLASAQPLPPPPPPLPSPPPASAVPKAASTTLQRGAKSSAQSLPTMPPPPVAPPPAPLAAPSTSPSSGQASPVRPKVKQPKRSSVKRRSLSSLLVIKGAMFTGFVTCLLAIAILSIWPNPIGFGMVAIGFVGMGVLQIINIIGGSDLPILSGLGLGAALMYEFFFGGFHLLALLPSTFPSLIALIFFPVMAGLLLTSGAILFLLIYRLLSQVL